MYTSGATNSMQIVADFSGYGTQLAGMTMAAPYHDLAGSETASSGAGRERRGGLGVLKQTRCNSNSETWQMNCVISTSAARRNLIMA